MKPIRFTRHASEKFVILAERGCPVERSGVLQILREPEVIEECRPDRRIAQGPLNSDHVLCVVFEENETEIVVATLYPGRRSRYEGSV